MTIGGFETRFKNAFGITCQICYSKGRRTMQTYENYNEMTLSDANAKLKADGADEIKLYLKFIFLKSRVSGFFFTQGF